MEGCMPNMTHANTEEEKNFMTNDLTVYFEKYPCLCAGNGVWTAYQQGGKAGMLLKVSEKPYTKIKGSFFK